MQLYVCICCVVVCNCLCACVHACKCGYVRMNSWGLLRKTETECTELYKRGEKNVVRVRTIIACMNTKEIHWGFFFFLFCYWHPENWKDRSHGVKVPRRGFCWINTRRKRHNFSFLSHGKHCCQHSLQRSRKRRKKQPKLDENNQVICFILIPFDQSFF